nr:uncharacterized protein LOC113820440 [Penaeus vannamei]
MASNDQRSPAVRVLLLWTLSWLSQSSGQELCAFNQSLQTGVAIDSFADLQAMETQLSACCWTAPDSCKRAGGFCVPAWGGRFCPGTNDVPAAAVVYVLLAAAFLHWDLRDCPEERSLSSFLHWA